MDHQSALDDPRNVEVLAKLKAKIEESCKNYLYDSITPEESHEAFKKSLIDLMEPILPDPKIELPEGLIFQNDTEWNDEIVLYHLVFGEGIDLDALSMIHVQPVQGNYQIGWNTHLTFKEAIKRIVIDIEIPKLKDRIPDPFVFRDRSEIGHASAKRIMEELQAIADEMIGRSNEEIERHRLKDAIDAYAYATLPCFQNGIMRGVERDPFKSTGVVLHFQPQFRSLMEELLQEEVEG